MIKIKEFCYTVLLLLISTHIAVAQDFISPDSSCANTIEYLKHHCYACSEYDSLKKCKIEEFGHLGRVDSRNYYYQIYQSYDTAVSVNKDSAFNENNLDIFEGINKTSVKYVYGIGYDMGIYFFNKPELVNTKYGYVLHINMLSGNGDWDSGDYFIFREGEWKRLKIPNFIDPLSKIIPEDDWFCRGSTIDLGKMIIEYYVYKKNDACCCPTGGKALANLKITIDNKIIITSTKYIPEKKAG